VIQNAKITSAFLGFEGHGILTVMIQLEMEHSGQGFGGYNLDGKKFNACGVFIRGLLETLEINEWEKLKSLVVRIDGDHSNIHSIGHIVKDKWFNPLEAFKIAQSNA
jgi:hypothetical protein